VLAAEEWDTLILPLKWDKISMGNCKKKRRAAALDAVDNGSIHNIIVNAVDKESSLCVIVHSLISNL